jgi:hypothetical protein
LQPSGEEGANPKKRPRGLSLEAAYDEVRQLHEGSDIFVRASLIGGDPVNAIEEAKRRPVRRLGGGSPRLRAEKAAPMLRWRLGLRQYLAQTASNPPQLPTLRIPSGELRPFLQHMSAAELAQRSGLSYSKARRIRRGETQTVNASDAKALLRAAGLADEYEQLYSVLKRDDELVVRHKVDLEGLEDDRRQVLRELAIGARAAPAGFAADERDALNDVFELDRLQQDRDIVPVSTPPEEARRRATDRFVEAFGRPPRELPDTLLVRVDDSLRSERERLDESAAELERALGSVDAKRVYRLTEGARRAGFIPPKN